MPVDGPTEAEASERNGAGAAAEMERFDMEETSREREWTEPRGALSRPRRLKPVPAVLFLFLGIGRHEALNEKARRGGRAYPMTGCENTERPKPRRGLSLFGGDGMWIHPVRGGILRLAVGEEGGKFLDRVG